MNFQPLNILDQHSTSMSNIEDSEYNKCGERYLTYFEKEFLPGFYILLDNDIVEATGFAYYHLDLDGNIVDVQGIQSNEYTRVPTTKGVYYFFNTNIVRNFNQEGTYQITLGYTDSSDLLNYFEVFDTYKFVDVSNDCYHKVTFSNDCNIDGLPIERLDDFKFCFYTSKESSFGRLTPIFEPEFETNVNGEDIATYKRMFIQETFRLFNINENLLNTIFYASIFDNFEISYKGETKDEVFKVEFADPTYQGDTCCIFYLDITLIREYKTNNGCCDEVPYTDCLEFDLISVESVKDDSQEPTADNNLCHLIKDDIANPVTEWTSHLEEVACGDGLGGWTYSTPLNVFDESNNTYWVYEVGSYVNNMFFIPSLPPVLTYPDFTINIDGKSSNGFLGCIFYSIDGGTTYTELPGEYTSNEFSNGFQIVIPDLGGGKTVNLKVDFKLQGCTTVEYVSLFSIMS